MGITNNKTISETLGERFMKVYFTILKLSQTGTDNINDSIEMENIIFLKNICIFNLTLDKIYSALSSSLI